MKKYINGCVVRTVLYHKERVSRICLSYRPISSWLTILVVPVPAGLERDGRTPLHIACAWHEGLRIPGFCGPNTQGARIAWGGQEVNVRDDYEVLVWRDFNGSTTRPAESRTT